MTLDFVDQSRTRIESERKRTMFRGRDIEISVSEAVGNEQDETVYLII